MTPFFSQRWHGRISILTRDGAIYSPRPGFYKKTG